MSIRGHRPRRSARRRVAAGAASAGLCALAVAVIVGGSLPGASALRPAAPTTTIPGLAVHPVEVSSKQIWTDTKIHVAAGSTVIVRASGTIHFGAPPIDKMPPAGLVRATVCRRIGSAAVPGWPEPALDCWTLMARVGTARPIQIGASKAFRSAAAGELFLGINDNRLADNSGHWAATVSVITLGNAAAATPGAKSKSKSSLLPYVVGAAAVLLLLVLFAVRARSKAPAKRRPARVVAPVVRPPPAPVSVVEPAAAAAVALVDIDSTVGNILDVEFVGTDELRVGYSHFPEDTVVHCAVARNNVRYAGGDFTTESGGDARLASVRLDGAVPGVESADLTFSWAVAGVPFQYAVRREMSS